LKITRRGLMLATGGAAMGRGRAAELQCVRLGVLHTVSPAPSYIAKERGYFATLGIDLTFVFFEAAQPIAAPR
jgi:NitT/TauT family transport system substrate-binding protein